MADPHDNADPDRLDRLARYLITGVADAANPFEAPPSTSGLPPLLATDRLHLDRVRRWLADEAMWASPPPDLIDGIISRVDEEPAAWAGHRGAGRRRRGRARALAAAAVVMAALLTVGILRDQGSTGDREVALSGTELAPEASATAYVGETPTGVSITLHVASLGPAPSGFYYQAWVKGRAGLVAIGTFHMRQGSDQPIELWSGVALAEYPDLTVTVEPEDGDPASSGQRVLTGTIAP